MIGWLGMTMATGGLYVFTMGLTLLYRNWAFYRYSLTINGKIVGTEYMDIGNRRQGYAAIIEFELKGKSKKALRKIKFQGTELKSKDSYVIGSEISVRYIPEYPEAARINSFGEIFSEPMSGIIVGGAFCTVGMFFLTGLK
jgi:hypothetical protein